MKSKSVKTEKPILRSAARRLAFDYNEIDATLDRFFDRLFRESEM